MHELSSLSFVMNKYNRRIMTFVYAAGDSEPTNIKH